MGVLLASHQTRCIMKKSPFRILIADQQPLTRIGLRQLLQNSSIFCYVGEVAAEDKMIKAISKNRPDLLLFDRDMPLRCDITLFIKKVKRRFPDLEVVILTANRQESSICRLIKTDISGYILKDESEYRLLFSLEKIARGEKYYSPNALQLVAQQLANETLTPSIKELTPRERQVLKLLGQSLNNEEIALKLCISHYTVRTHISRINAKLGFSSRSEAIQYVKLHEFELDEPRLLKTTPLLSSLCGL